MHRIVKIAGMYAHSTYNIAQAVSQVAGVVTHRPVEMVRPCEVEYREGELQQIDFRYGEKVS